MGKGDLLPNTYTPKTAKRYCLTCKREITHQHPNSRFCSSKYVDEKEAKKCRNQNSNLRTNLNSKIREIAVGKILYQYPLLSAKPEP